MSVGIDLGIDIGKSSGSIIHLSVIAVINYDLTIDHNKSHNKRLGDYKSMSGLIFNIQTS